MSVQGFANEAANVPKLVDINARFAPSRNVNVELARSLSPSERLAVWVTDRVGSMGFFFAIAIWTILWLGWNTVGPAELRFDPGPSFLAWLFVSNLLRSTSCRSSWSARTCRTDTASWWPMPTSTSASGPKPRSARSFSTSPIRTT